MEYRSAAEPVELSAPDRSGRAVTPAATTVANSTTSVSGTTPLATVSLDDKYTATSGSIFLSGIQALVRLPLLQYLRDQKAGLNTAGFISGYRGSPLGGLDEALWKAQPHLAAHKIKFQPGTNEDMAATAVWGTQHWPRSKACSPCGTARDPAWTAAATCSST